MAGQNDMGERGGNESRLVGESSQRRKYIKHNANKIQELEAFFKENPRPNKKERQELGAKLSIDSNQLKFWFQNKRNQVKSQSERRAKGTLKQENDKLRAEQIAMKEAMRNPICNRCGERAFVYDINVDEYQTKLEHARLTDDLKRIKMLAKKLLGPSAIEEGSMAPMMENSNLGSQKGLGFGNDQSSPPPIVSAQLTNNSLVNEGVTYDRSMLMDIAISAMNELLKLAENGEPLWIRNVDGCGETLNLEEYARLFSRFTFVKPIHFTTEATRAVGTVFNNCLTLVETLMDKSRWVEMFSCIVGTTSTTDVISNGVGGSRSGTLQLIKTEFQIISEMVPVREIKFLRFCKQLSEGVWVVVDVSLNTIQQGSHECETGNCRRLPSGCVVQDMFNGYSKVTWVEHMEYNENIIHHLFRPLIRTGLGFGAQRWIANLQRKSEFLAAMMPSINTTVDHAVYSSSQKSIGMLAQRMTRNFCAGVCGTIHKWELIQPANGEDARLMMRKNVDDPGEPIGVVLSATKTIWLPMKQHHLFEFFMNKQAMSQWNFLSSNGPMQQMVHIFNSQNLDSSISLFVANGSDTSLDQNNMIILQDTCTDATGSLLVYAAIDSQIINAIMNGGDSSFVPLLPFGIAIVPDCCQDFSGANNNESSEKEDNSFSCGGSLVTIGLQVLMNSSPTATFSMESAKLLKDLISRTIRGIKSALKCE